MNGCKCDDCWSLAEQEPFVALNESIIRCFWWQMMLASEKCFLSFDFLGLPGTTKTLEADWRCNYWITADERDENDSGILMSTQLFLFSFSFEVEPSRFTIQRIENRFLIPVFAKNRESQFYFSKNQFFLTLHRYFGLWKLWKSKFEN